MAESGAGPPQGDRQTIPNDPMWQADLLSAFGHPFHLAEGIDVLIGGRAEEALGLTVLLQNPFGVETVAAVEIGPRDVGESELIEIELVPLEVVILDLPMTVDADTEIALKISSNRLPDEPRIRTATPGKLDLGRSAAGVAAGLATLLLTPVGHFSWSRSGGDVDNPFQLEPTLKGKTRPYRVTARRLWSPPDEPRPDAVIRRRRVGGREVRWARLVGVTISLWFLIPLTIFFGRDLLNQPSIGLLVGAVLTGGLSLILLNAIARHRFLVRDRISRLGPAGPGTRDVQKGQP